MSSSSENEYSHEEDETEKYDNDDLAASNTESDEDVSDDSNVDDEDEDEDEDNTSDEDDNEDSDNEEKPKTKEEIVTENLINKYAERQGKQLYIRFPHKLPEDEDEFQQKVHAVSPLIVKAHKPRQRHARFCLIDFKSREDRDAALKSIKAATKEKADYKLVVSLPRTENEKFVQELVQRKLKTLENRKAKARLRRASKLSLREKNFTSSIVVLNLPKSATVTDVRKLFSNAVDVQMKPGRGNMNSKTVATITLPSTTEARAAFKQKHSFDGTQLVVRFDKQKPKQQKNSKANRKLLKSAKERSLTEKMPRKTQKINKAGMDQAKKQKAVTALAQPPLKKTKGGHVEEPPAKKIKKNNADIPAAGQKTKKGNAKGPLVKKLNILAAAENGGATKTSAKSKSKQKNK